MVFNNMVKMMRSFSIQISKPITCSCIHNKVSTLAFHNDRKVSATVKLPIARNEYKYTTNLNRTGLDPDKARIISSLNFKSPEDAEPFYHLPVDTLLHIQRVTIRDKRSGYCENRLYYISSKIKCPPAVVSEKLANRSFVYRLSFGWLENSLNELIDKGVSGDRIIRDLWVLKYHHNTIRERLQKIKDMGIENLYPWMVRCSPKILDRYMNITRETKSILGETKSTQMYLAERLNISIEDVEDMCVKIPALKTIRVTKVKKFLDFLIEEGYNVEEIASKPRILASSQKTIKYRLEELNLLGIKHVNLNVLCRSRKHYKRYRESLEMEHQK